MPTAVTITYQPSGHARRGSIPGEAFWIEEIDAERAATIQAAARRDESLNNNTRALLREITRACQDGRTPPVKALAAASGISERTAYRHLKRAKAGRHLERALRYDIATMPNGHRRRTQNTSGYRPKLAHEYRIWESDPGIRPPPLPRRRSAKQLIRPFENRCDCQNGRPLLSAPPPTSHTHTNSNSPVEVGPVDSAENGARSEVVAKAKARPAVRVLIGSQQRAMQNWTWTSAIKAVLAQAKAAYPTMAVMAWIVRGSTTSTVEIVGNTSALSMPRAREVAWDIQRHDRVQEWLNGRARRKRDARNNRWMVDEEGDPEPPF
jgi:hypothetical protein